MIGFLQTIVCILQRLVDAFVAGAMTFVNDLIAAIGGLLTALVQLLPTMPAFPSPPTGGVLGALNWLVPIPEIIGALSLVVTLWLVIVPLRLLLRWIKLL